MWSLALGLNALGGLPRARRDGETGVQVYERLRDEGEVDVELREWPRRKGEEGTESEVERDWVRDGPRLVDCDIRSSSS